MQIHFIQKFACKDFLMLKSIFPKVLPNIFDPKIHEY